MMNISEEKISQDLNLLVTECSRLAKEAKAFDPLKDIAFTLNSEKKDDSSKFTIQIDRNSGGSPESDYAIQDEVFVLLSADGNIEVAFYMEMMEQETLTAADKAADSEWKMLLEKINQFCRKNIPEPFPGMDY